jgi:hypothetical protein
MTERQSDPEEKGVVRGTILYRGNRKLSGFEGFLGRLLVLL